MRSFQHPSLRTSPHRRAPIFSRSTSPQCRIVGSTPMPFMPVVQAKLRVGAPNDKYEQEANRVADQIMRMPWGPIAPRPTKATQSVQRLCAECASGSSLCPECAEEEETIHAKARPGQAARADLDLTARLQAISGGGQPLPARERSYFEAWFGRDFSATRIHTGQAAADVAAQVNARAFTFKRDIVFGAGEYPHDQGRDSLHLLAHELTHVVQQGGAVDGSGGNSNANPARAQFATDEPETVRKAPVSPAHPSTNAIFQRWLGGGAVAVTYHPETPKNAEVFPIYGSEQCFHEHWRTPPLSRGPTWNLDTLRFGRPGIDPSNGRAYVCYQPGSSHLLAALWCHLAMGHRPMPARDRSSVRSRSLSSEERRRKRASWNRFEEG